MSVSVEGFVRKPRSWRWVILILIAILVFIWLYFTPPGVWGKADAIGYSVCHRIAERSFIINGRQLPLCARCTGQFLGAMLALIYQAVIGKRRMGRPALGVIAILVILFITYAIDGLNSYLHLTPLVEAFPSLPRLYEPSNLLRLLTGTGIGLVIGAALYPSFNSVIWQKPDPRPALGDFKSLAGLILLSLGLDALLLLNIPWIMLTMAILSALATLTLLALVYTIVVVMLFHQENRAERLLHVVMPFIAGLGIAFLQIAVFDLLRYQLTGTWEGFFLG